MRLHLQYMVSILLLITIVSCTSSKTPLFGKRSAHEKYGDGITDAGLKQTHLGAAWFSAAAKSITQPQPVTLPYKETGYFSAEKPSAAGYIFSAKRGEKIIISVKSTPATGFHFFGELWQPGTSSGNPSMLTFMDTLTRRLQYSVEKDGQFIMRLQPELLRSVEYTIDITTSPSLAFPVHRSGDPKLISLWGVGRDGGTRSHEGVDIGAKFRTPALAAADGYVTRVNENSLGGKVVFLNASGYSIYYAHLDSQSVYPGQRVTAGDVVGLVGKTGNAQNTVPHLHFGIYTNSGAIDPLAFIDSRKTEAKPVTASLLDLNKWMRTTSAANVHEQASAKSVTTTKTANGDAVFLVAAAENWYKVILPTGQQGFINSNMLTNKVLRKQKTIAETRLLDEPNTNAPSKMILAKGKEVEMIGNFNNFYLVKQDGIHGWIMK